MKKNSLFILILTAMLLLVVGCGSGNGDQQVDKLGEHPEENENKDNDKKDEQPKDTSESGNLEDEKSKEKTKEGNENESKNGNQASDDTQVETKKSDDQVDVKTDSGSSNNESKNTVDNNQSSNTTNKKEETKKEDDSTKEKVASKKKETTTVSENKQQESKKPNTNKDVITTKTSTETKTISFKTTNKTDDSMYVIDGPKTKQKGQNGQETITYTITYKNGKQVKKEEVKRVVTKKPINEVVVTGTKDFIKVKKSTKTVELPYKVVEKEDPNLESGKKVVEVKGKNGKKVITYETTFKNNVQTKKEKVGEEVVQNTLDEVVRIGTMKVVYKETKTENVLPFKTVKKEDSTLEKGKTKISQVGKNGKEVITYKEKYVNGEFKSKEELTREIIEPRNEILLIGTLVVTEENVEVEEVINYQTIKKEDPNLDKGQSKVAQKGSNGKSLVVYNVLYHNGKEVERKEVSRKIIEESVDEIILIGTRVIEEKIETKDQDIDFNTIKKEDPNLPKGITEVKQKGVNGIERYTYKVVYVNGKEDSRTLQSKEVIKEPIDEILSIGTKIVETKEEKVEQAVSYKTVKENDPSLLKGETKVKQVGVNGKKVIVYTVFYENGKEITRTVKSEKVTVEPVDEIILVGTKVIETKNETKEVAVAFKTIEKEDSTLAVGETKVIQKGINGLKRLTYEVIYENGKEVSRSLQKTEVVKEAVDEIVLIGTKNVEIKEEKVIEEIPYKTTKEEDSTLLVGESKVKQTGKKGKKEIIYEITYENGKEISRTTKSEKVLTNPVDEIILVGTKVVEIKEVKEVKEIPFETVEQEDSTLPKGETKVKQAGKKGKKEIIYEVTYENGKEVSRKVKSETQTENPVNEIILVGTKKVVTISYNYEYEKRVVELVNIERAKEGLEPLQMDGRVNKVARDYSTYMIEEDFLDHSDVASILLKLGIRFLSAGENIAHGYKTPESVVEGWMFSPPHRANILNPIFTHTGVGYATDGEYPKWTQMFYRELKR